MGMMVMSLGGIAAVMVFQSVMLSGRYIELYKLTLPLLVILLGFAGFRKPGD